MVRLAPGHPCLPLDTPRTDRVSVHRASLSPLYILYLLMVYPFLAPETAWHIMHAKDDNMGVTQRVSPFLNLLRAATIIPLQGIYALTSTELAYATLVQQQGISTSLVPPPHPSADPDTEYPTASALPAASAGPTAISHEAGGDAVRAVGGGSTDPTPDLQWKHVISAPRNMEDGGATQEVPDKNRDGDGMPVHRREPALLPPAYPPRRRGHDDVTHLPHQGPRRSGGRPEYIFVSRNLSLGRVGGGSPPTSV